MKHIIEEGKVEVIITEGLLRDLEIKKGKLSSERCDEIDAMKIKNPYYHTGECIGGEYYEAERNETYICALDGRIAYTWASVFGPLPVTIRESLNTYDDIFLLFIDNEYFELIFDFDSQGHYVIATENKKVYHDRYILKENESLSNRIDKKELMQLITKLKCGYKNIDRNKEGTYFQIDLVYEGEEYKWMD